MPASSGCPEKAAEISGNHNQGGWLGAGTRDIYLGKTPGGMAGERDTRYLSGEGTRGDGWGAGTCGIYLGKIPGAYVFLSSILYSKFIHLLEQISEQSPQAIPGAGR